MKKIKKKMPRPVTHDQWIEVTRKDDKTITTFYPPNTEFERLRLVMDPPPDLIYRRYNFVHGVPFEYFWTNPSEMSRVYGGFYLQRILPAEWAQLYILERRQGNTIAISCEDNQDRPEAFGPCPCQLCTDRREEEYARLA